MTVDEAKKIIELCNDTISENDKVYVNKEYVFKILDMIETYTSSKEEYPSNINWDPKDYYPFGWPKVYYDRMNQTQYPMDIYGNPVTYCTCNSTKRMHEFKDDSVTESK